jgi:hypothetical protein
MVKFILFHFIIIILFSSCQNNNSKSSSNQTSTNTDFFNQGQNQNQNQNHNQDHASQFSDLQSPLNKKISFWPKINFPLEIKVDSSFAEFDLISLQDNFVKWNQIESKITPFQIPHSFENLPHYEDLYDYKDQINGVYFLNYWPDVLSTKSLGATQYFAKEILDEAGNIFLIIEEGDIFINGEYFNFSQDENPPQEHYDLPSVLIHELGHLIGLKHISFPENLSNLDIADAVMGSHLSKEIVRRKLTVKDQEIFKEIYQNKNVINLNNNLQNKIYMKELASDKKEKIIQVIIELEMIP